MDIPMQVALLISSFLVTLVGGALILPLLKKLNLGQNVRESGPESHLSKAGTPSMGGMIFLIPFVIFVIILGYRYEGLRNIMYPLLIVTLAYGGIGFLDDLLKVKKKSSIGLFAWQKMLLLLVVSGGYVYYLLEIFDIEYEHTAYKLVVNLNYSFIEPQNASFLEPPLFILRKEIMDMIGNKYANHVSRIGITSF